MSGAVLAHGAAHDGMSLVDAHTPTHFTAGVLAGVLGVDAYTAMMTFVGIKIVAQSLQGNVKRAVFGRDHAESLGNELVDLMAEMIGHHVGHYLRERKLEADAQAQALPAAGVGAYYIDPTYLPISGLGAYYVDPVYAPIR